MPSVWYERALKADPNHVRTWQYYGLWQVEQGNREQAKHHLAKIEALAGRDSTEYQSLAAALTHRPDVLLTEPIHGACQPSARAALLVNPAGQAGFWPRGTVLRG